MSTASSVSKDGLYTASCQTNFKSSQENTKEAEKWRQTVSSSTSQQRLCTQSLVQHPRQAEGLFFPNISHQWNYYFKIHSSQLYSKELVRAVSQNDKHLLLNHSDYYSDSCNFPIDTMDQYFTSFVCTWSYCYQRRLRRPCKQQQYNLFYYKKIEGNN